jgi:hypothetical protein
MEPVRRNRRYRCQRAAGKQLVQLLLEPSDPNLGPNVKPDLDRFLGWLMTFLPYYRADDGITWHPWMDIHFTPADDTSGSRLA